MDDLAGLGKIAESELAKQAYDDVASPAAIEIGGMAADIVKAFRLFTYPLQLAAKFQDRLRKQLDDVRDSVPIEKQQEATPEIAGPVMRALVFIPDESPLQVMYLNLLRRAIDKERSSEAHPAFASIIGQLCPDEALMLSIFNGGDFKVTHADPTRGRDFTLEKFPVDQLSAPELFHTYLVHLQSLILLSDPTRINYVTHGVLGKNQPSFCGFTYFGRMFANACIPQEGDGFVLKYKKPRD